MKKNIPWKALICFFFILLVVSHAFALDIDEKLTFRVLSTSSSKKTVLMNRGLEDGLAVGDHAKFFLTTGVIARAVIVKASPSRSIWSIYRLIDEAQIQPDKVLNLKIASPVKVTEDSTKSLQEESLPSGSDKIAIPAEEEEAAREKKNPNLNKKEKEDLDAMEDDTKEMKESPKANKGASNSPRLHRDLEHDFDDTRTFDKNFEIWSTLGTSNFLSTTIEVDGSTEKFGGGTSALDATLGIEKYFSDKDRWYHRFSLVGLGHYANQTVQVSDTVRSSASTFEYGLGINTHFVSDPFAYDKPIGFLTLLFGVGSSKRSTEASEVTPERAGTCQFLSFGPGVKYYLKNGIGGRLLVDYYRRNESYVADEATGTTAMNKTIGGIRVQFGLSWRF